MDCNSLIIKTVGGGCEFDSTKLKTRVNLYIERKLKCPKSQIPPEDREVIAFVLADIVGFTLKDVAHLTHVSLPSAYRARDIGRMKSRKLSAKAPFNVKVNQFLDYILDTLHNRSISLQKTP